MGCQVCTSSSRRAYEDFCSNLEIAALPNNSEFTRKINDFRDTIPFWLRSIENLKEKNKDRNHKELKTYFDEYQKQTKKVDRLIDELYKAQQGRNMQETTKFKKLIEEADKLVNKIKEDENQTAFENDKENLSSMQSKIKKIKETSL
jgi:esterase/lipase